MSITQLPPSADSAVAQDAPAAARTGQLRPRTARRVPLATPRGIGELLDAARLWRTPDAGIELSVVMPFYNPGPALRRTVSQVVDCLRAEDVGFEIIAVSDGSTDGSERTIDDLGREVRVLVSQHNRGKGAALHLGFARARGSWIGFIDSDGDIAPEHLVEYLKLARETNPAAVYADKRHVRSESACSTFRKLVSLVYTTLVTMLFFLGVADTQTGCKIFRRDVLATLLPRLREQRFAFDLEFFVAAKAAGIRDLVGAPVRLGARLAGSTVTSGAILRTIRDTFVIFGRLHLDKEYRPRPAHRATASTSSAARQVAAHWRQLTIAPSFAGEGIQAER